MLVITDHFSHYDKNVLAMTKTAKATGFTFWNHFNVDYGSQEKLLTVQGRNFENNLIRELCCLAEVRKIRATPYHPKQMANVSALTQP